MYRMHITPAHKDGSSSPINCEQANKALTFYPGLPGQGLQGSRTPTNGFICVIKFFPLPKGLSSIPSFPAVEERALEGTAENTALVRSNKLQGACFLFHYPAQQLLKWKVFCTSKHQGEGDGRKERNDEGEMKAKLSLHCSFAFPITVADEKGKMTQQQELSPLWRDKSPLKYGRSPHCLGKEIKLSPFDCRATEVEASSAVQTGLYAVNPQICT